MSDLVERAAPSGWLIEDRSPGVHSLYMTWGPDEFGRTDIRIRRNFEVEKHRSPIAFTKDANEAIRFARKKDAEGFVRVFRRFLLVPEVTEHCWPAPAPAPATQALGAAKARIEELEEALRDAGKLINEMQLAAALKGPSASQERG